MPVLTAVLVVGIYAAIAVGRVPYLRMNRAEIALVGAATLIVAEVARAYGARLGFVEYLKAGIPITLLTLLAGVGWLSVVTEGRGRYGNAGYSPCDNRRLCGSRGNLG
jgi:hypothetical protein